jgi:hypothetical protein
MDQITRLNPSQDCIPLIGKPYSKYSSTVVYGSCQFFLLFEASSGNWPRNQGKRTYYLTCHKIAPYASFFVAATGRACSLPTRDRAPKFAASSPASPSHHC